MIHWRQRRFKKRMARAEGVVDAGPIGTLGGWANALGNLNTGQPGIVPVLVAGTARRWPRIVAGGFLARTVSVNF